MAKKNIKNLLFILCMIFTFFVFTNVVSAKYNYDYKGKTIDDAFKVFLDGITEDKTDNQTESKCFYLDDNFFKIDDNDPCYISDYKTSELSEDTNFLSFYCEANPDADGCKGKDNCDDCTSKEKYESIISQCRMAVYNTCSEVDLSKCDIDTDAFKDYFNNSGNYKGSTPKDYLSNNKDNCTKENKNLFDWADIGTSSLCNSVVSDYKETLNLDASSAMHYDRCYKDLCNSYYNDICEEDIEKAWSEKGCNFDNYKSALESFQSSTNPELVGTAGALVFIGNQTRHELCTSFGDKYSGTNNRTCAFTYCLTHFRESDLESSYFQSFYHTYNPNFSISGDINTASSISASIDTGTLSCSSIQSILDFFNEAFTAVVIVAFVLLVIMSLADYAKVVGDGEKPDDALKKANKHLVTRIAVVTIIVLLPVIVNVVVKNIQIKGSDGKNVTVCSIR